VIDWETKVGKPFRYYTYAAVCIEVEVDTLTGDHHLLATDIVQDAGEPINPKIDIGQIEGAFVQGVGWATIEDMVWADTGGQWLINSGRIGQLYTKGPGLYKLPTADDIPIEMNVHLYPNFANADCVQNSRGLGEPPICLSVGVIFALKDAIIASREENGVFQHDDMDIRLPMTCEAIRMACRGRYSDMFIPDTSKEYKTAGSF